MQKPLCAQNSFLMKLSLLLCLFASAALAQLGPNGATASFKGSLPPKPTAGLSTAQAEALQKDLSAVTDAFQSVKKHPNAADADIFIKAVRYALEFHEWYDKKPEDGIKKATALLDEAKKRIESLKKNETPWLNGTGEKVLGFYSKIDGSPQPYGVEVPDGLEFGAGKKPVPMWVWLHGRGDTATDLSFVYGRLMAKKRGQFTPAGTIVIHPFGRYCNGWKSAGETDALEARDDAKARFNVDHNRIALAGFSMGGAGAWSLGAHFAGDWACVHTGAGFVDVKRYTKLTPETFPNWYEQKLWGVYDVPDYVANFHNVPLISYSGEVDTQRDSAEYMTQILKAEGIIRPHLIGPGMPHKYHPEVIKEVQKLVEEAVAKGREEWPSEIHIQTRTLAYNQIKWAKLTALEQHWKESRLNASLDANTNIINISTKGVIGFEITPPPGAMTVSVDGKEIQPKADAGVWKFSRAGKSWVNTAAPTTHVKKPGLQGPIEDGLKSAFLVVLPDSKGGSGTVDAWVEVESNHFLKRWKSLMRGDALVKAADDVTAADMASHHLVLWGTPATNSLIAKILPDKMPLAWSAKTVAVGTQSFPALNHVPVLCYPNPLSPEKYVILNSGLTFREAHDRTNSIQNPKLPDWAILDITEPPNSEAAGKVVAADFFDEHWQVLKRVKSPTAKE
ncbi:MAG: phospholipase/Carboxylesterase [Verrucomicrobiaceae bacterium]|nr:phospholipase/Carboxylesterase [Verrucomicrobiaceae bacterium]